MPKLSPSTIEKRAYSVREFREMGGPSRARQYQLIAAGKLAAVKDGRRTLIPSAEVARHFAALEPVKPGLPARQWTSALKIGGAA